jgi:hypothetical protein
MLFRRLIAGLLVVALFSSVAVSALAQEKKDEKKPEEKKEEKGGDKVSLKWKFEKDKVFYQKMVTKTVQTMNVMGNPVSQTQNQTFYFSFKPTKIDGDKVTIEQKIEGVAMDIDIGGNKISYDSTKDTTANNPLGEFFKALVGTTFTISYDTKTNTVTDVDGRDAFINKLTTANPQMKPLLEVILSKDALKEMADPVFAIVPKEDVAKDGKWKRESKLDMGPIGKYENTYNYTYKGIEGAGDKQAYMIAVDTALNYKEPGEAAGQGGLPFKIKSAKLKSSNPVGKILFSTKGRLEKSELKISLSGDLDIEIGGTVTKVKLDQTQESTIETSDTNPVPAKK